jgi:hypothetical protein
MRRSCRQFHVYDVYRGNVQHQRYITLERDLTKRSAFSRSIISPQNIPRTP